MALKTAENHKKLHGEAIQKKTQNLIEKVKNKQSLTAKEKDDLLMRLVELHEDKM